MLWLLAIPALLVTVLVFYYHFDETLRPDVATILNTKPADVPAAQNGYFALLGLAAPDNVEPFQMGQDIVAASNKYYAEKGLKALDAEIDIPGSHANAPQYGKEKLCNENKVSVCLSDVRKNKTAAKALVERNQLLLKRYQTLHHASQFQQVGYLYPYSDTIKVNKIFQAFIALEWDAKHYKEAFASLQDEHAFWRRVMNSDVSLTGRMVSLAILQRNLQLVAELTADCPRCLSGTATVQALFNPLQAAEYSVRNVIEHDARFMYGVLDSGIAEDSKKSVVSKLMYTLAFKKNAAVNKIFTTYSQVIQLSECPLPHYTDCYQTYSKFMDQEINYLSWAFIEDPMGTSIAEDSRLHYDEYIFAAINYEAKRRLVMLKTDLGMNNIKPDDIAGYLLSHGKAYSNPLNGQPVEWDAQHKVLRLRFPPEIKQKPVEVSL